MGAILSAVSMIQSALGVVSMFKGSAEVARVTGYVQDAVGVVNALTPLVTAFGEGKEVTEQDVADALAGKDKALADLDALIKAKSAE